MKLLSALVAGLLFGSGLLVSGMVNPAVVLSFLDVSGAWNPALAFVMVGAIAMAAPAYFFIRRRGPSRTSEALLRLASDRVDLRMITGAAIFGIGWGLAGICPGPGLVLLTGASVHAVVFVTSMVAGMLLAPLLLRRARGIDVRSAPTRATD
jgi:uncharacterized membrane protein YedE/YeeE